MVSAKKQSTSKKSTLRFVIDLTKPVEDEIIDAELFEKFLQDRIKVNGRTGQLGDAVKISRERSRVIVVAKPPFSKRYLKYLIKKYLKQKQVRDWLKVISTNKQTYEVRYFNIHDEEEVPQGEETA